MTNLRRCLDMLERCDITHVHTKHANAYRQKSSEAEHLPSCRLAKTVIVRSPNDYLMVGLPANCEMNLEELAAK